MQQRDSVFEAWPLATVRSTAHQHSAFRFGRVPTVGCRRRSLSALPFDGTSSTLATTWWRQSGVQDSTAASNPIMRNRINFSAFTLWQLFMWWCVLGVPLSLNRSPCADIRERGKQSSGFLTCRIRPLPFSCSARASVFSVLSV